MEMQVQLQAALIAVMTFLGCVLFSRVFGKPEQPNPNWRNEQPAKDDASSKPR
jgi:hypothetical protein